MKRVPWKFEKGGVKIFELCNNYMRGVYFQGGGTSDDLCIVVGKSSIYLQDNNIPYIALIAYCGKRFFLNIVFN